MKKILPIILIALSACNTNKKDFDAAGYFEADEVFVSAQQNGTLESLNVTEGMQLTKGQVAGQIDVTGQILQKQQTEASIKAIQQKTVTPNAQVEVARSQLASQQTQMQTLQKELTRITNLVNADAAPRKQLDDIKASIDQLQSQMAVTRQQIALYQSNSSTQNRGILAEQAPMEKAAAGIQYQIDKGTIINPINGTVLNKFAMQGELANIGRPLYSIANIDTLTLKAYITADQLSQVKIGQEVTVRIDDGKKGYISMPATVSSIATKAEFTPKTIQTKTERQSLVYAVKALVKNNGQLKIGMYGELLINKPKS